MNNNTPPLRVLIIGSGAIGTYVGGSLALSGHHVTFLERPARVQAFRDQGLIITIDGRTRNLPQPAVTGSLETALKDRYFDVALFALKSYHTAEVAAQLEPFRKQAPAILCLQNGIGNELTLAKAIGQERVIAGTITTSATREKPGVVHVHKKRGLGLSAGHPLSDHLLVACEEAGLNPTLYKDPHSMKWTKLLTNLMGNATSAILDMTPGEIYGHPDLYRLEIQQLREALTVMKAQSLRPVKLPGIPSKTLSWVVNRWPPALSQPLLSRVISGGRGGKMPSFHNDLHAGKNRNEVEYLNGAVLRTGKKLKVDTPINALLNQTLLRLVAGEIPLDTYAGQPERLLSELQ